MAISILGLVTQQADTYMSYIIFNDALVTKMGKLSRLLLFANGFQNKLLFSKIYLSHTTRVSNSFDPDQAIHFIGPDPGPKYLLKY